jgi:hypothetical protein
MLKRIVTLSIVAPLTFMAFGCEEYDPMAGTPDAPKHAQTTEWQQYRNCRERLQYAKDKGEISAQTLADNIRVECENGFKPAPNPGPGNVAAEGTGTR